MELTDKKIHHIDDEFINEYVSNNIYSPIPKKGMADGIDLNQAILNKEKLAHMKFTVVLIISTVIVLYLGYSFILETNKWILCIPLYFSYLITMSIFSHFNYKHIGNKKDGDNAGVGACGYPGLLMLLCCLIDVIILLPMDYYMDAKFADIHNNITIGMMLFWLISSTIFGLWISKNTTDLT